MRCPDNLVAEVVNGELVPCEVGVLRLALDLQDARARIAALDASLAFERDERVRMEADEIPRLEAEVARLRERVSAHLGDLDSLDPSVDGYAERVKIISGYIRAALRGEGE